MVIQTYAIKSHLTSLLSSRNHSTIYQLVFTVKTVKIQLDDLVARHYLQAYYGHISPSAHQRLPWRSPTHCSISTSLYVHVLYMYTLYYISTPLYVHVHFILHKNNKKHFKK